MKFNSFKMLIKNAGLIIDNEKLNGVAVFIETNDYEKVSVEISAGLNIGNDFLKHITIRIPSNYIVNEKDGNFYDKPKSYYLNNNGYMQIANVFYNNEELRKIKVEDIDVETLRLLYEMTIDVLDDSGKRHFNNFYKLHCFAVKEIKKEIKRLGDKL